MIAGGSLLFHHVNTPVAAAKLPTYKTSKAKKSASAAPLSPVRIVIDKSDYELHVYDSKGWYATYPVVFGNDPLMDKKMEGDKCTPEGTFKIVGKRPHEKWSRFMLLDYPNQESWKKFQERKKKGIIPATAASIIALMTAMPTVANAADAPKFTEVPGDYLRIAVGGADGWHDPVL